MARQSCHAACLISIATGFSSVSASTFIPNRSPLISQTRIETYTKIQLAYLSSIPLYMHTRELPQLVGLLSAKASDRTRTEQRKVSKGLLSSRPTGRPLARLCFRSVQLGGCTSQSKREEIDRADPPGLGWNPGGGWFNQGVHLHFAKVQI